MALNDAARSAKIIKQTFFDSRSAGCHGHACPWPIARGHMSTPTSFTIAFIIF